MWIAELLILSLILQFSDSVFPFIHELHMFVALFMTMLDGAKISAKIMKYEFKCVLNCSYNMSDFTNFI